MKTPKNVQKTHIEISPTVSLRAHNAQEKVDRRRDTRRGIRTIAIAGVSSAGIIKALDILAASFQRIVDLPGLRTLANWPLGIIGATFITIALYIFFKGQADNTRDTDYNTIIKQYEDEE
jgi:hypothetical protein